MLNEQDTLAKWEEAYGKIAHDAVVGRLMKGIVHNLNGVMQAFSMQAELFFMMFSHAEQQLPGIIEKNEGETKEKLLKLQKLFEQRAVLVKQMEEKVAAGQKIINRTLSIKNRDETGAKTPRSLNTIAAEEIDFLQANMFYKHKVEKKSNFADLPELKKGHNEIHHIVLQLLINAIEALGDVENPAVTVESRLDDENMVLVVEDNGPGMTGEVRQHLFDPFFTSKTGHAGLGLYMAKQSSERIGAVISVETNPGATRFLLKIPMAGFC